MAVNLVAGRRDDLSICKDLEQGGIKCAGANGGIKKRNRSILRQAAVRVFSRMSCARAVGVANWPSLLRSSAVFA